MTTRTWRHTDLAPDYDVVVVGGRCAGAATAMLLARLGHRVAVLERSPVLGDTLSTHGLARGGVVQLHRWGLLDPLLATGAPAVTAVAFATPGGGLVRRALRRSAGLDLLVAPRRSVLDGLLLGAAEDAGATVRTGVEITGVLREDGRVSGVTARGPGRREVRITARLVVGADGLRSRMARLLQAPVRREWASPSSTFYTYVPGLLQDTYQFHVGEVEDGRSCLAGVFPTHHGEGCVWLCLPTDQSGDLRTAGARRAEELVRTLRRRTPALGDQLTAAPTAPVRGAVGLPMVVRDAVGSGWALVGDAGYHRDPVTGHGITDAFRDAELLARAADTWLTWAPQSRAAEDAAMGGYQEQRDTLLRDVFRLTDALTRYPDPAELVARQRELAEALDAEADWLAALPVVDACPAIRDLVPA